MPTAGAVVTSHNQHATLAEAVESALAQTLPFDRVLVIDDGSTDSNALDDVLGRPEVEVFLQEQRGVSAARNAGIARLDTDLVAVLDGDDAWEPSWGCRVREAINAPGVVGASSWMAVVGVGAWLLRPSGGSVEAFLGANACPASVLFRRADWVDIGGYDETMTEGFEDWDFALRILERGGRIDIVEEPLLRYRTTEGSANIVSARARVDRYASIIDRHPDLFARHYRAALLALETTATKRLDVIGDLLIRHPEEPTDAVKTYGDGGLAAAVRVLVDRESALADD